MVSSIPPVNLSLGNYPPHLYLGRKIIDRCEHFWYSKVGEGEDRQFQQTVVIVELHIDLALAREQSDVEKDGFRASRNIVVARCE